MGKRCIQQQKWEEKTVVISSPLGWSSVFVHCSRSRWLMFERSTYRWEVWLWYKVSWSSQYDNNPMNSLSDCNLLVSAGPLSTSQAWQSHSDVPLQLTFILRWWGISSLHQTACLRIRVRKDLSNILIFSKSIKATICHAIKRQIFWHPDWQRIWNSEELELLLQICFISS